MIISNMFTKILPFITILFILFSCQNPEVKLYYDKDWKGLPNQDGAKYYRLMRFNDKGDPEGVVKDYDITGTFFREGIATYVSKIDDRKSTWEKLTLINDNGTKAKEMIYDSTGQSQVEIIVYDENGNLDPEATKLETELFIERPKRRDALMEETMKIVQSIESKKNENTIRGNQLESNTNTSQGLGSLLKQGMTDALNGKTNTKKYEFICRNCGHMGKGSSPCPGSCDGAYAGNKHNMKNLGEVGNLRFKCRYCGISVFLTSRPQENGWCPPRCNPDYNHPRGEQPRHDFELVK